MFKKPQQHDESLRHKVLHLRGLHSYLSRRAYNASAHQSGRLDWRVKLLVNWLKD